LISPAACGAYLTQALLTPWSEPLASLTDSSSFQITRGPNGGACPGPSLPFAPQVIAGTHDNYAGSYSPMDIRITREDGQQDIQSVTLHYPPGLSGILSGIPFCPEADIATARTVSGAQEEGDPSCPAASKIGHTIVSAGVGSVLAYTPGKIYMAGQYLDAPFSIV
jgi:hypothetical protein